MTINVKFEYNTLCRKVLCEQLDAMGFTYTLLGTGEIDFKQTPSSAQMLVLSEKLSAYGIEIISNQQTALVQRIKDAVTLVVNGDEEAQKYNVSTYLSEKLDYSYAYLSNLFSEITHTSIENFVILKKIDVAKTLIIENNLTLTEIAYKLNYSSVAHLSTQFKKTTGLTPSSFQKIIKKRKEKAIDRD
ncbi:helix-turn-helix domain-containing protein [Cellulophaga baltica]|uniref:Transcriptional regulator, AraC family n=2 Tax=Cellulophaga baltica TaxID=76594 RepID=A0A1G7DCU9_9FLAO|nr:AraC family transcriptional regulator [Cellulophaga baltica]AIY12881.1 AraC family transcriptional regulator [Cellulophaga baltica NN016038]AIZ41249.1 AraC family transcriptional regulator [Cellulophaga baltica 18]SDE49434.1 transcriptional regulator, AraC family [Cellulophaga baltica]